MESNIEYKKAYAELYEIIKALTEEERKKIPESYIEFVKDNMDNEYSFTFDKDKSLLEQDIKKETKALLVNLYKTYIANEDEKEYWNKYDSDCFERIEEEKRNKYNPDIFSKEKEDLKENQEEKDTKEIAEYKESFKVRFIKFFKKLFGK